MQKFEQRLGFKATVQRNDWPVFVAAVVLHGCIMLSWLLK